MGRAVQGRRLRKVSFRAVSLDGKARRAVVIIAMAGSASLLLSWFVDAGQTLLPVLGLIFVIHGIADRDPGLFVPGGILGGIGFGISLIEGPFRSAGGATKLSIWLLAFALSQPSVNLLSAIFTGTPHLWALVPGGILWLLGLVTLSQAAPPDLGTYMALLWVLPTVALVMCVSLFFNRIRPVGTG